MSIVKCDVDEALYVGNGPDGCYVHVGKDDDGWYYTVTVDSETGHFVDDLATDIGPYGSRAEALRDGKGLAIDWCCENGIDWTEDEETEES